HRRLPRPECRYPRPPIRPAPRRATHRHPYRSHRRRGHQLSLPNQRRSFRPPNRPHHDLPNSASSIAPAARETLPVRSLRCEEAAFTRGTAIPGCALGFFWPLKGPPSEAVRSPLSRHKKHVIPNGVRGVRNLLLPVAQPFLAVLLGSSCLCRDRLPRRSALRQAATKNPSFRTESAE